MKKLTSLAALLLAVSAGTTAFAQTEYYPTNESVKTSDQHSYKTVLITKGDGANPTAENIVYIAQAAGTFGAATDFLLKHNSADGTGVADGVYTIRLGSSDGQTTTKSFAVGVGVSGFDTELTAKGDPVQDANGTYSLGFVTPDGGVALTDSAIILVKIGDNIMAYPVDSNITFTGSAAVKLGVQIDDVPEADKGSVKVYLRQGGNVERKIQTSATTE